MVQVLHIIGVDANDDKNRRRDWSSEPRGFIEEVVEDGWSSYAMQFLRMSMRKSTLTFYNQYKENALNCHKKNLMAFGDFFASAIVFIGFGPRFSKLKRPMEERFATIENIKAEMLDEHKFIPISVYEKCFEDLKSAGTLQNRYWWIHTFREK